MPSMLSKRLKDLKRSAKIEKTNESTLPYRTLGSSAQTGRLRRAVPQRPTAIAPVPWCGSQPSAFQATAVLSHPIDHVAIFTPTARI